MEKNKKLRFIHIKKNGGTSVYKFLRKNDIKFLIGAGDEFDIKNQHVYAINYANEDSWKFCVVRNPYSRLVSFYNWTIRLHKYKKISFDQYIKEQYNRGRFRGAWDLQLDYMLDKDGKNLIDKIFKFETMSKEIPNYFNITAKFPHLNSSHDSDYRNYYNDELQEIVYNKLKDDFDYLGYDKCLI